MWKLHAHIPIESIAVGEWVEFGARYFLVTRRIENKNRISLQLGQNLVVHCAVNADIGRAHQVL